MFEDLEAGKVELVKADKLLENITSPRMGGSDGKSLKPFEPTSGDLDIALQTCRSLMVHIMAENDLITKDPLAAIDVDRPVAYIRPQIFRKLLPRRISN
ncbi:hypothetical protein BST61_g2774 [Cercospora zeina]